MAVNRKRLQERAAKYRGWLLLDKKSPLLYRKELIYEGEWQKLNSDGEGIAFAVATNTLNHWKESLSALREAGIKTPLTKSHENWDLPENKLGEVTAAHVSENDAGLLGKAPGGRAGPRPRAPCGPGRAGCLPP